MPEFRDMKGRPVNADGERIDGQQPEPGRQRVLRTDGASPRDAAIRRVSALGATGQAPERPSRIRPAHPTDPDPRPYVEVPATTLEVLEKIDEEVRIIRQASANLAEWATELRAAVHEDAHVAAAEALKVEEVLKFAEQLRQKHAPVTESPSNPTVEPR